MNQPLHHIENSRHSFSSIAVYLSASRHIRRYAILTLLILLTSIKGVNAQLSPDATITILTCAPGDELYSIFGHTALRVNDPEMEIDYVFNYGTFNFNTPNFYLKFMRGHLNYMLSVTSFDHFMMEYRYTGRSVWEQKLELSEEEKDQLFRALTINARPENKYYHYHFFFDNCATRVRDMAIEFIPEGVRFEQAEYIENMSFRDAIAYYLEEKPWTRLGLDLLLGQPTDDKVDESTIQFLPDFLMWQFETATRIDNEQPLVEETITLMEFDQDISGKSLSPAVWLWLLAMVILVVSWVEYRRSAIYRWVNLFLFTVTTLLGLLICFLWFFTAHSVTGPNWHILWANPLHLSIILASWKNSRITRFINLVVLAGIIVTLLFFALLPQYIPMALIPVWIILIVRILPLLKKN